MAHLALLTTITTAARVIEQATLPLAENLHIKQDIVILIYNTAISENNVKFLAINTMSKLLCSVIRQLNFFRALFIALSKLIMDPILSHSYFSRSKINNKCKLIMNKKSNS